MRIANENLIAAPVDMTTSFSSRPIWLGHICNYAIQLVFTGSPVGTLNLQCSNDPGLPDGGTSPQALNVVNWTDVLNSSQAISAAGNHVWDVQNAGYTWVRVNYVATSGSGSLTVARANLKGV
jgi:hypothetical protein